MKRFAPVALIAALIVAGFVLPACAQRSTTHSGSSGHSSQGFHGGFAGSAPRSTTPAPRRFATSPGFAPGRTAVGSPGATQDFGRGGSGHSNGDRHRRPYISSYGAIPYAVLPWGGGLYPGYLGYPDDTGSSEQPIAQVDAGPGYASGGDAEQLPDVDQPEPRRPYRVGNEMESPTSAPLSEEAVTIVFKDGRPPEQIHNYILTRTTLSVQDQQRRNIPLDQLDIAATEKVNKEAGVDFQLPNATP